MEKCREMNVLLSEQSCKESHYNMQRMSGLIQLFFYFTGYHIAHMFIIDFVSSALTSTCDR